MASAKMGAKRSTGRATVGTKLGNESVKSSNRVEQVSQTVNEALLSAEQLNELISALRTQKEALVKDIRAKLSQVSKEDMETGDEMDQAAMDEGRMLATQAIDRDTRVLHEVERALERVEEGTYGICEGTDEPIGYSRLRLNPWTRYSITYQEELERDAKRSYNSR